MRVLTLLLLLPLLTGADDRRPKYEHQSPDQGFAVAFPGKPRTESRDLTTLAGVLSVHTTRFDTGNDLLFTVTYTEFPKNFVGVRPEKLFEGMLKEMAGIESVDGEALRDLIEGKKKSLTGSGGKVVVTNETPDGGLTLGLDRHPGRQWRIETGKVTIRVRAFLVGSRLYQVMANGSRDAVTGKTTEAFFASFELMKK